ncbi:MAG TPA: hypothetical protein VI434_04070 [Candidatus Dormibacteraeota bacterium]
MPRCECPLPAGRPGVRTGPVTLGNDGAIYAIGGTNDETMGRYTSSGVTTGIQIPGNNLIALLPSSGGTFWVAEPKLCIGQPTDISLRINRFAPDVTDTSGGFMFPVAISLGAAHQLGVDATSSLWEAGAERSDPDRFFRMDATGTIDRSAAFPTVGGATLHTDGTLVVSNDGALWASAQTPSSHEYLIRFVPSP